MTDAEKDAAWRSLPENDKAVYRRIYHREANAGVESYGRGYRDALADAFGKHNLSATEEEKPRFKVGDLVLVKKEFDFGSNFGLAYAFCVTPHPIREIADGKAFLQNDWDGSPNSEYTMVPLDSLISYTEGQEPKEGNINNDAERIMLESLKISASARLAEKNIKWHVYRMELAKAICPNVICAVSDNGVSSDFCKSVIDKVTTIVDGIVERLKGGEK